jgi:hypothetical protein
MEAAEVLAERLMAQYAERVPLKQVCDEILVVLREGGLRIGDPVPSDLVAEAEQRLAAAWQGQEAAHGVSSASPEPLVPTA